MTVLYDVWLVDRLASRFLTGRMSDSLLSPSDYAVYSLLEVHGPVTSRDLEGWTGMPATSASAMLARIDERGHLDRRPNPKDGRSTLVGLTEAGRAAAAEARRSFQPAVDEVDGVLGPRLTSVRVGLRRLDDALRTAMGIAQHPGDPLPPDGDAQVPDDDGPPLTADQETEVRRYMAWIRVRDAERSG